MTDTAAKPARKPRPEGQWALGQTEPLNENEQFKAEDNGLNVRTRIEEVYSRQGFGSIPPEDLRGRMRWWGLYTQRRPGIPGGKTASLPPEEPRRRVLHDAGAQRRRRPDQRAGARDRRHQHRILVATPPTSPTGRTSSCTGSGSRTYLRSGAGSRPSAGNGRSVRGHPRVILGSPVPASRPTRSSTAPPRSTRSCAASSVTRPGQSAAQVQERGQRSPRQDVAHEINDISFGGSPGTWSRLRPLGRRRTVHGAEAGDPAGAWVPLADVPDVWLGSSASSATTGTGAFGTRPD